MFTAKTLRIGYCSVWAILMLSRVVHIKFSENPETDPMAMSPLCQRTGDRIVFGPGDAFSNCDCYMYCHRECPASQSPQIGGALVLGP